VYGPPDLGFRRGLHLQHGCDLENLLCSPWEDGRQQWWRLRARWLGRPSTAVRVAPGGDPTREIALMAAVWVGYPAPGIESRRGASARWIDNGGLLGGRGSVGAKSAR
jgi:hypothetical protein